MHEQTSHSDGPLSEAEYHELLALLHRYCSYDLDQWEAWRMQTEHGEVYIHISRQPAPGSSPQSYDGLPSPTQ